MFSALQPSPEPFDVLNLNLRILKSVFAVLKYTKNCLTLLGMYGNLFI